ncbi:MAG: type II toxin-antitoxin system HipA family toxin, partial [Delftia acidovorans]
HKMVVLYDEKTARLQEPFQGTASSHILKPDSTAEGYPHSTVNEAFTMKLAGRLGLDVPPVHLLYTPEPAYVINRFDRVFDEASQEWLRLHVVDACQLLDLARTFKYQGASIQTLASLMDRCREKAQARMGIYQWLLFNTLVGNSDSHLKNLSFLVDRGGVRLAPFYDLLSTAVYHTRAYADEHAVWPQERLTVPLAGAAFFADVTYGKLLAAGTALGLTQSTSGRVLDRMLGMLAPQADTLIAEFEAGQLHQPADSAMDHSTRSAHLRMLRSIRHIVIEDMLALVRKTK